LTTSKKNLRRSSRLWRKFVVWPRERVGAISTFNQYAEAATGNRDFFLNKGTETCRNFRVRGGP
jgi:hypothetical protein